jgi:hypothetical protein
VVNILQAMILDAARFPRAAGAPIVCAILEGNQAHLLESYRLGLELLFVNGILVFAGLFVISQKERRDRRPPPRKPRQPF